MGGLVADVFLEWLFRIFVRLFRLINSRDWPIRTATVLYAECTNVAALGCEIATLHYDYTVNGKKYSGAYEKPFIFHSSGVDYANQFAKGAQFKLRVKPGKPEVSVPFDERRPF